MTKIAATGRDYGSPVEYEYVYHERSPKTGGLSRMGNFFWENLMVGSR
jgi:hypothetical protein